MQLRPGLPTQTLAPLRARRTSSSSSSDYERGFRDNAFTVDVRQRRDHAAVMKTRIIRSGEGEIFGSPAGCRDRFLIDSKDWGGNIAVVEHLLAPRSIAAPMHLHTK